MTYATPYNAEESFDVEMSDVSSLPPELAGKVTNKTGPAMGPRRRTKRAILPTFSLRMGPKTKTKK